MWRTPSSAVASGLLLALLAGCGAADSSGETRPAPEPRTSPAESADGLPSGWRWESYRGVEVGVPASWDSGRSTGQVTSQWCSDRATGGGPVVARPAWQTSMLCLSPGSGPKPGTLIEDAGVFVAFDSGKQRADGRQREGDRTTVTSDGVSVLVQADPELRKQIISTIRTVDSVDSNGCPIAHPISSDQALRPHPSVDVAALSGVTAVAGCKYGLGRAEKSGPSLLSSLRVEGQHAAAAIAAIAAAPTGGGPDTPSTCLPSVSYGDDAIVLRISSSDGEHEVFLRYSGCDHNGLDDGFTERTLTAEAVAPFITGSNAVLVFSGGGGKEEILYP